jgi:hypothetical protein
MKQSILFFIILFTGFFSECNRKRDNDRQSLTDSLATKDTIALSEPAAIDSVLDKKDSLSSMIALDSLDAILVKPGDAIDTKAINPGEVIRFAESLVGTPYVYGSSDPKVGFDCSGFITYVFNHFKIKVPRSSVEFTNMGRTIPVEKAKRGDIILFTDPDFDNSHTTEVGHIGLITSNESNIINFIHSTSGKAMSVAISPLSDHYKKRFVRVGRIFPQNDD